MKETFLGRKTTALLATGAVGLSAFLATDAFPPTRVSVTPESPVTTRLHSIEQRINSAEQAIGKQPLLSVGVFELYQKPNPQQAVDAVQNLTYLIPENNYLLSTVRTDLGLITDEFAADMTPQTPGPPSYYYGSPSPTPWSAEATWMEQAKTDVKIAEASLTKK